MLHRYLEILDFTQFFDHFVFTPNTKNVLEKELKREIPVSVGIELVVVDNFQYCTFNKCAVYGKNIKWISKYTACVRIKDILIEKEGHKCLKLSKYRLRIFRC